MEGLTSNLTNGTMDHGTAAPVEFSYFSLVIILVVLLPIVSLDLILLVIIAREKTIAGSVRFLLGNILAACIVVVVGLVMLLMSDVILSACNCGVPSVEGCRVMFWIVISGGAARLLFMAVYSVVVYVIVKTGTQNVKFTFVVISVIVAWLATIAINSSILVPEVLEIAFVDQISCAPYAKGVSMYAYSTVYLVLFGISSFLLTIIMPIITLVYVKKHSIASNKPLYKAMAFFGLFLLIGNASNFLGQAIPILLTIFVPPDNSYEVLVAVNYILGIFIILSLIPTPVFVILLFKPVQKQFVRVFMYMVGKKPPPSVMSKSKQSIQPDMH